MNTLLYKGDKNIYYLRLIFNRCHVISQGLENLGLRTPTPGRDVCVPKDDLR